MGRLQLKVRQDNSKEQCAHFGALGPDVGAINKLGNRRGSIGHLEDRGSHFRLEARNSTRVLGLCYRK